MRCESPHYERPPLADTEAVEFAFEHFTWHATETWKELLRI
jgi:hypothetical protein